MTKAQAHGSYLPPGQWIDYKTRKAYGGSWHTIQAGEIAIVRLVREGVVIPHIALAQSTAQMDWSQLELVVYSKDGQKVNALACLPSDKVLHRLSLTKKDDGYKLDADPLRGKVNCKVKMHSPSISGFQ